MMSLYDSVLYDEALYDADFASVDPPPTTMLEFGKAGGTTLFSMHDEENTFIEDMNISGPVPGVIQFELARDDGIKVINRFDRARTITAIGWVQNDDLFDYMDTIKKNLRHVNGYLYTYLPDQGIRQFTATLVNMHELFSQHRGSMIGWSPVVYTFLTTGYGRSIEYTLVDDTVTTSPWGFTCVNEGSVKAKPIAVLTFDSASSVTVVTFENTTTGEYVTYTGSVSAGDVLEFDSDEGEVRLNGVAQTYSGAFPSLDVDTNNTEVLITGSSFSVSATVKWKSRYS